MEVITPPEKNHHIWVIFYFLFCTKVGNQKKIELMLQ